MKGVDISKACGYDGASNKIIKICSEGLRVILLILLICLSYLLSTRANVSLQILFLNLKLTTSNSKWITVLFLCMLASFSKICERVVFFHLYNFFLWKLALSL